MSHIATNWLAQIRGLPPGKFVVLFHLCDCHNPSNGCFPSQNYLMKVCCISNGSVNNHLVALEKSGLVQRIRRRDGNTKRMLPTRYKLRFEFSEQHYPTPEPGVGANSKYGAKPTPYLNESQLQNLESKEVIEPVSEPVTPLTPQNSNPRSGLLDEFEKFWKFHPRRVGKGSARSAFFKARKKASLEELAIPLKAFVENLNGTPMDKIPHPSTWLNQERWLDDQTHAANRSRTATDDLSALGCAAASTDLADLAISSERYKRLGQQNEF